MRLADDKIGMWDGWTVDMMDGFEWQMYLQKVGYFDEDRWEPFAGGKEDPFQKVINWWRVERWGRHEWRHGLDYYPGT